MCESYAQKKDMFKLTMSGFTDVSSISYFPGIISPTAAKTREICRTCMGEIVHDLKLDNSNVEIENKLFDNFKLPQPDDDLGY